jgi:hypothetical protein
MVPMRLWKRSVLLCLLPVLLLVLAGASAQAVDCGHP